MPSGANGWVRVFPRSCLACILITLGNILPPHHAMPGMQRAGCSAGAGAAQDHDS